MRFFPSFSTDKDIFSREFNAFNDPEEADVWLIGCSNITEVEDFFLNNVNLDFDDFVFVYEFNDDSDGITIYEVYRIGDSNEIIKLKYGEFKTSLSVEENNVWERRADLKVRKYEDMNLGFIVPCLW